ncbi:von Willebrand factor A domain-containing protein 5A-like [Watersipora subatra]|uniref:von Willebrand factor A domain-containing protein 5A-like n=1 Tax=Watersipora subatra TaxID=2589382 RepID=UPI00355C6097
MRHRWGVYMSRLPAHSQLNSFKASQELKPVRVSGIRLFTTINGLVGDVSASIQFYNHLPVSGPGVFLFPLNHSASVKQCHACILNRVDQTKRYVTLEVRQIAEHEKDSRAGFLIEQSASNVVELQLGLLAPGDQVEVTLQYAMLFDVEENALIKFVFPTFLPRELQSHYTELCTPEIYDTLNLQCRAIISGEYRIRKVVSDHKLAVNYKNEQRKYVQIDTVGSYVLSKDFCFCISYYDLDQPHVHTHSPVTRREKATHWLQSSYCAHLTLHHAAKKAPSIHQKNEYILCLDRSGSMYGSKIELLRDAVTHFIRYLQPGSFFNIISFGSTIRPLFKTSQKLTAYSTMKALKLRNSIKANMFATNIYSLLEHIYSHANKTGNCKQSLS